MKKAPQRPTKGKLFYTGSILDIRIPIEIVKYFIDVSIILPLNLLLSYNKLGYNNDRLKRNLEKTSTS